MFVQHSEAPNASAGVRLRPHLTYSPRELLASGDGIDHAYDGFGRRVTATETAGSRVPLYDPQMQDMDVI